MSGTKDTTTTSSSGDDAPPYVKKELGVKKEQGASASAGSKTSSKTTTTATTTGKNKNKKTKEEEQRPTNAELRTVIRRLIPKVNLQKTGVKAFIKLLSKECGGLDLKHRAEFIKEALSEAINEMESDESDDDTSSNNNNKDATAITTTTTSSSSSAAAAKKKPSGRGKGLSIKKEISEKLATFLKQGPEMARTEIVKALWDYIKEHDLQNPENKREILLDNKMQTVFGCEAFTMFTMNKYIAAHIYPFKEVDLTPKEPKPRKKRKRKNDDPPIKKKRKAKKPGLQPPYKLSDEMIEVVGKDILPRPQVVTALWAYIKDNNLQNPNDKREILCDDKLKSIMGGNAKVTMFNMNRYITDHLVEKLDRSAYTHEDAPTGSAEDESDDE